MSPIISYAIIAVFGIGALVGWSNSKKGASWGQPVTIICAIICIGVCLYRVIQNAQGPDNSAAMSRELRYQQVQTKVLGEYVAKAAAGKKALLLKDMDSKPDNPMIMGLKEGLAGAIEIVDEVEPVYPKPQKPKTIDPNDPNAPMEEDMIPPMEEWFTAKDFEKLVKGKLDKVDILITMVGLPRNVQFTGKDFNTPSLKGKKVIFAGGSIYEHGAAFQGGGVIAAVTYKPKAIYDEAPVPKDDQKAFDKRYLLVTAENWKSLMETKEYKDIFYHK